MRWNENEGKARRAISDMDFCGAPDEARKENGKWRERKKKSRVFFCSVLI